MNNTYKEVHNDCVNIISRHLDYMGKNGIEVQEQHEQLPSFYLLPKLHKKTYGSRFIAASNKCTTKQLSSLLTYCFKTIITIINNIVMVFITILGLIVLTAR